MCVEQSARTASHSSITIIRNEVNLLILISYLVMLRLLILSWLITKILYIFTVNQVVHYFKLANSLIVNGVRVTISHTNC
ncbi:Uncharacterised protein [Chlamydia trachomatis]|nr:Uncharacterised protein [Chlamydia trachomatis]